MVTTAPQARLLETAGSRRRFGLARLGADLLYVLPGFFISTFAFVILVTLFALSLGTLVVWIGVALLPLTLFLGSGFAELSRARLRQWGVALPRPRYRPRGTGVRGYLHGIADPRRWMDLVFETVVAFPLRIFTFCAAVTWIGVALGGLTWWSWAFYLPEDEPRFPGRVLEALTDGAAPDSLTHSFAFESAFYLVLGAAFAVTLPFVARALAWLDALTTSAALGAPGAADDGTVPEPETGGSPTAASAREGIWSLGSSMGERREAAAAPAARAAEHPPVVSATGWAWIAAAFAAVVACAVGWPVLAAAHRVPVVIAMLIVLAQIAALLLLVRWPWIGIGIAAAVPAATALTNAWGFVSVPSWPVTLLLVQTLLVLLVSLRESLMLAAASWFLPLVVSIGFFFGLSRAGIALPSSSPETIVVCAAVSAGVGVIGVLVQLWWRSRSGLVVERRQSAALSAEKSELAERNRIAQELHDVVAHSMSVISVQATTAKYRLDGVGDAAAEEFASIAESSRRALAEMRGLLGVLRVPDGETPLAPQPGAGEIAGLVEDSRRSGASIEFTQEGDLAAVPAVTGLAVYRIVQEGLSNAMRHSPGAGIRVRIVVDDEVRALIENGPVPVSVDPRTAPGSGLGLQGIRDRVRALGGRVETGALEGGGFRVDVVLPLG